MMWLIVTVIRPSSEVDDDFVAKIVIVTPRPKKQEGFDRTGQPFARKTFDGELSTSFLFYFPPDSPNTCCLLLDDAARMINDGLVQYEKEMK